MASSSKLRSASSDQPHVLCIHQDVTPLQIVKVQGLTRGKHVNKLEEINRKLEDDVVELTIENTEQLAVISSATADKKLYNVLVTSWIFFASILLVLVRRG
ncbi:Anthranilate N-benzoyltransferase protein 3 [Bienertia sinuspersici]